MLLTVLPWYCKVSWGPILASTCFRFWSKTLTKCCTNNSLLSRDKTISLLLEFWKTLNWFPYWWKTYTHKALHKQICNITCQKTFLPCTLQLVRCFQFQGMIYKTKECHVSKNIAKKHGGENLDFDFVLLLFSLLT